MGNILLINGVLVPEPTGMKPNEYDITKSNRTVTGLMKGHVVRHDVHKIECSWKVLDSDQYGLKVFYHIPDLNKAAELTMYVGDRTKDTLRYVDGKPIYKNVKMNFIEE